MISPLPFVPRPLSLALDAWPADDRAAWLAASEATDDPFAEIPRTADWAPATRARARWSVGRFMAWMDGSGVGLGSETITIHVTPEALAAFVREEQQRKRLNTIATHLFHLVGAFELFAPDLDWSWAWALHWRVVRHARLSPPLPHPLVHSARYCRSARRRSTQRARRRSPIPAASATACAWRCSRRCRCGSGTSPLCGLAIT